MRTTCAYCGEELWGYAERNGVCLSCQGAGLDEVADDYRPDGDEDDCADCVACEVTSCAGVDYGREHTCNDARADRPTHDPHAKEGK